MRKTNNKIDPIPDEFASEQDAGKFWDIHNIADYEEFLEPVDMKIELTGRHYEIEIDEESFNALYDVAKKQNKPIKNIVSDILKEKLALL